MLVYLDNCMFNRPFDDQDPIRVRLETEAKLYVQEKIKQGELQLIWSYILAYENSKNPFYDRRLAIAKWEFLSTKKIMQSNEFIQQYATNLSLDGIASKDALHVACAVYMQADYFLTTDDKLLKKLLTSSDIKATNPTFFIQVLNDDY